MKPLAVPALAPLASGIPTHRAVRAACRLARGRRRWLMAGAIAVLGRGVVECFDGAPAI